MVQYYVKIIPQSRPDIQALSQRDIPQQTCSTGLLLSCLVGFHLRFAFQLQSQVWRQRNSKFWLIFGVLAVVGAWRSKM